MRHVEAIAREAASRSARAAEEPVRAYIMAELKALGFEPEIQQPARLAEQGPESESKPSRRDVRNIVARWRGSGPPGKKALLLSAHYDSVDRGPGAGDDASGVAAILESLRALKAGPAPERDVIILINDGEEAGPVRRGRLRRGAPLGRRTSASCSISTPGGIPARRTCSRPATATAG